jgi:hypothetical protein
MLIKKIIVKSVFVMIGIGYYLLKKKMYANKKEAEINSASMPRISRAWLLFILYVHVRIKNPIG